LHIYDQQGVVTVHGGCHSFMGGGGFVGKVRDVTCRVIPLTVTTLYFWESMLSIKIKREKAP
jgi:hypothetical protein